jgi:mannonate dehydratase
MNGVVQSNPAHGQQVLDFHVHFGSPRDTASGCYWSKAFERTAAYAAMLLLTRSAFKKVDFGRVKQHLFSVVNGSNQVAGAVFLALDQVYERDGTGRPDRTHLHVPNRCILGFAQENFRILFGASVHPYRTDWEQELDSCIENGAVLCKWIPSSQRIDPSDPKCGPFLRKLADHRLPLLCHAGLEYSIPPADPDAIRFNNPGRLRYALDEGVTVVVAHCSLPYFWILDTEYQDDFREFLALFDEAERKRWKLYADLSALTGFFRAPYIREEILRLPHERLVFGSDYPIPLSELSYHRPVHFFNWLRFLFRVGRLKNPLDKNAAIIRGMGFRDCVFTNAQSLISSIRRSVRG